MKPFLSVIMPIYNGEKYLRQSIESVLNQECKELELILVDDGSIDNSKQICNEYLLRDRRIAYYFKTNGGVSSARNLGIKKSIGEYIAFLDCDDVWCKKFYTNDLYNEMKDGKYDILSFGFFWANKNCTRGIPNETVLDADYSKRFSLGHMVFWSFVYKRKLCEKTLFDETIAYSEDYHFLFRALGQCKSIKCFNKFILAYRNNKNSTTRSASTEDTSSILSKNLTVWIKLRDYFCTNKVPNGECAIEYCENKIVCYSSNYITESIIKGVSPREIEDNLSKYVDYQSLKKYQNDNHDDVVEHYLEDFDEYYYMYRKANYKRIIARRLRVNKLSFFRKLFIRENYIWDIKEYF